MPFLILHWRAIGALVLIAALGLYIESLRLERDLAYKAEAKAKAELMAFRAEVEANGKKAQADKIAKEAADKKRKEDADHENSDALATLAGTISRMRRDRPAGGGVSQAPSCPGDPSRAAFDRAKLERAYGSLVEGVRGLADEGSRAVIGLDAAKNWAKNAPNLPRK